MNPVVQSLLEKLYKADIEKHTPKSPKPKTKEPVKEKKKEVNQSPFLDL